MEGETTNTKKHEVFSFTGTRTNELPPTGTVVPIGQPPPIHSGHLLLYHCCNSRISIIYSYTIFVKPLCSTYCTRRCLCARITNEWRSATNPLLYDTEVTRRSIGSKIARYTSLAAIIPSFLCRVGQK